MVSPLTSTTATISSLSSPLTSNSQAAKQTEQNTQANSFADQKVATRSTDTATTIKQDAAKAAEKMADSVAAQRNATRVTISQQQPEPNTANRNTKPVDQYKAVSAIRS